MNELKIGNRIINKDSSVFIIAELSANHNHEYELAVESIKAAKDAGADAVKIQTYTPDTITIDCDNKYFQIDQGTIWDGKTLYKLYQEAYTPWDWQPKLKKIADDLGIILFSSPFDKTSVDFLEKMDVPAYKVASLEINDTPLIKYIASKNKPVILSTGVAELSDIEEALAACSSVGNEDVAILKCTSAYPTPFEEVNLNTIPDLIKRFGLIVGLSDHTKGIEMPVAAVTLGAKIIEKHFILDKKIGGPDSSFSLEIPEFKEMVAAVRNTEKALGIATYDLTPKAKKSREHSRSLFVVSDMKKGDIFTELNVRSIRPGFGLEPKYIHNIIGKHALTALKKGTPLQSNMVDGSINE